MEILNKISRFCSKKAKVIRFLLILVIALWVNFYLIPDLKIPVSNIPQSVENNITYLELGTYFQVTPEDLGSGNINTVFWKIIYLGSGKDHICFEKSNSTENETVSTDYNNEEFFNISKKNCFDIPKGTYKIKAPNLKYDFKIIIPANIPLPSERRIVNKSECVWFTGENTCITQEGIDNAVTLEMYFPNVEVYLEANWFHKFIKFVFIFFSTGAVLWGFTRTFYLIKYGWDKK